MGKRVVIAVPPGVGDTYWCLTKLAAYREAYDIEHVTIGVQKTSLDRALDWAKLAPSLVNAATTIKFRESKAITKGFAHDVAGADCVMWPNAIVDRGIKLSRWLPDFAYDDKIPTVYEVTRPAGDVVLFPAHAGINSSWFGQQPARFWETIAQRLEALFGKKPVIIGSYWDQDHCRKLESYGEYLVEKTSLQQVAAIIDRAQVLVGCASGMSILANHYRTPCVALFPRKHHPLFPWTWVPFDAPYAVFWNDELDPVKIADKAHEIATPIWLDSSAN